MAPGPAAAPGLDRDQAAASDPRIENAQIVPERKRTVLDSEQLKVLPLVNQKQGPRRRSPVPASAGRAGGRTYVKLDGQPGYRRGRPRRRTKAGSRGPKPRRGGPSAVMLNGPENLGGLATQNRSVAAMPPKGLSSGRSRNGRISADWLTADWTASSRMFAPGSSGAPSSGHLSPAAPIQPQRGQRTPDGCISAW
jgi:hypothetical protein